MPAYDSVAFKPAAPIALVSIRSLSGGPSVANVPMLLDTGADASLVPRESIAAIIDPDDKLSQYELEAFDGTKSLSPAVRLEVRFLGKSFRGQFLIADGTVGILGRNVLNSVSLLFEGPKLTWQEIRQSP